MSSMTTAPDRPEQADSAEQAWFDLEAQILVAEVENYLATAAQQRRPAQATSARAAAACAPAPAHTVSGGGGRWSPRPAPTTDDRARQRAPPRREHADRFEVSSTTHRGKAVMPTQGAPTNNSLTPAGSTQRSLLWADPAGVPTEARARLVRRGPDARGTHSLREA